LPSDVFSEPRGSDQEPMLIGTNRYVDAVTLESIDVVNVGALRQPQPTWIPFIHLDFGEALRPA